MEKIYCTLLLVTAFAALGMQDVPLNSTTLSPERCHKWYTMGRNFFMDRSNKYRNIARAERYFNAVVASNNARQSDRDKACYSLGCIYGKGYGVIKPEYDKAEALLSQVGTSPSLSRSQKTYARYLRGMLYSVGDSGLKYNFSKATLLLSPLVNSEHLNDGQRDRVRYALGGIYATGGTGVPRDFKQAVRLLDSVKDSPHLDRAFRAHVCNKLSLVHTCKCYLERQQRWAEHVLSGLKKRSKREWATQEKEQEERAAQMLVSLGQQPKRQRCSGVEKK